MKRTMLALLCVGALGLVACDDTNANNPMPASGTAPRAIAPQERNMSSDANIGSTGTVNANNTGVNQRDRNGGNPTADNAGQTKTDVQLAADIRRSVIGDKNLSVTAHNVKIVVQDGKVTLRGPVKNQGEKDAIAADAAGIVGATNVDNQLQIEAATSKDMNSNSSPTTMPSP